MNINFRVRNIPVLRGGITRIHHTHYPLTFAEACGLPKSWQSFRREVPRRRMTRDVPPHFANISERRPFLPAVASLTSLFKALNFQKFQIIFKQMTTIKGNASPFVITVKSKICFGVKINQLQICLVHYHWLSWHTIIRSFLVAASIFARQMRRLSWEIVKRSKVTTSAPGQHP